MPCGIVIFNSILFSESLFTRNAHFARQYCNRAVEQKFPPALFAVVEMHDQGNILYPHNIENSKELFREAADLGYVKATGVLAGILLNGGETLNP